MAAIARDWVFLGVAIGTAVWADHWAVSALAIVFIGYMQFCLGEALLHEASHYNLLPSRRLHGWLQPLYAFPFLQTLAGFQEEHLTHHSRLLKEGDQTWLDYEWYGLRRDRPNLFLIWFVKPLLGYPAYIFLRYGTGFDEPRGRWQLITFWSLIVAAVAWMGQWPALFCYWLLPLIYVTPMFNYWSEIEEHYNTRSGARSNVNPVANFFSHNEGYHWIHHRYPTIPFYRLAEAHRALAPEGTDETRHFFETYRQLKAPVSEKWPCHPETTTGPLRECIADTAAGR